MPRECITLKPLPQNTFAGLLQKWRHPFDLIIAAFVYLAPTLRHGKDDLLCRLSLMAILMPQRQQQLHLNRSKQQQNCLHPE